MIGVLHPKPPHQSQWDYWGAAPQTSSPVSMGILGCCTPNLLTSLNGIIRVLHPKPFSILPIGCLGCSTLNRFTNPNGIIAVLNPKPPHQSQWDYWGAAPQTSSPVSMGILGCCTPNLLTSLNGIIGVLYPKTPDKFLKPPDHSQ